MGSIFKSPKKPDDPPPPTLPPQAPEEVSPAIASAREQARRKRAGAARETLLTGPSGLNTPASTARKALLGN